MAMSNKSREKIEALRAEARDQGDGEMVLICDDALEWGDKRAAIVCLGVIRYARAEAAAIVGEQR
tara:strand:- start:2832 stop:3026 length:195 start_codon:yes stop_codon:yes gene_type:complete